MRHNRSPKPGSKYYLPRATYHYVVQFCLSYDELKSEERRLLVELSAESHVIGVSAYTMDGMPHGTGVSDPTAKEALTLVRGRERLERELERVRGKISVIERVTRQEVGHELYPFILEGITTEGATLAMLEAKGMPLGKNLYSEMRRRVYYAISKQI